MRDIGILLQHCNVAAILLAHNIRYDARKSKRGYELYFPCPTNNHIDDPDKRRMSIAESGQFKGMFNCWSCGFKGNIVHLLQHLNKWDFMTTVEYLERHFGSSEIVGTAGLIHTLEMSKPTNEEEIQAKVFSLPDDYKLLTAMDNVDSVNAISWLNTERNISCDFIEKYQIGGTYNQKLGFMVVVPVYFQNKLASIFYAQPWKGGAKRYPKDSPQGEILFNYDSCLLKKSYIMVESILDVIKIDCTTGQPSMACFTNMISKKQLELLKDFSEHGVMPDLDGERGWDLVDRMVPTVGKSLWLYFVPLGKDPGDCTKLELENSILNRIRYCDYETTQLTSTLTRQVAKTTSIYKR